MKRFLMLIMCFALFSLESFAQTNPRNTGGKEIILQAWHWNLVKTLGGPYQTLSPSQDWYSILNSKIPELKAAGITMLYLPPPWRDDSTWGPDENGNRGGGEGYFWHDFDLNSRYGSAANLKTLVDNAQVNGIDVIYDMVPNHRDHGRMVNDKWPYPGAQWRIGGHDSGNPFMNLSITHIIL